MLVYEIELPPTIEALINEAHNNHDIEALETLLKAKIAQGLVTEADANNLNITCTA